MSSIRMANVSFAYPQQVSLIDGCTLDFGRGWTGIVGRNGGGKTTLLDLVDGTLEPTNGRIDRAGLCIGRCHQRGMVDEAVASFANAWTSDALKWMSLLALDPGDFWRWDELSPGERRRWQIGAAVYSEPGALLLDEPTNHLDVEGRDLLVDALSSYAGVGLVVSHDRAFLDRLCDQTARVHRGSVRLYRGAYSDARDLWIEEEREALDYLESVQATERALRSELNKRSAQHASSVVSLSSRSRMTSIRDSDARSTSAKGRARRAEASLARDKSVVRSKLERVRDQLEDLERPGHDGGSIFVEGEPCRREFALQYEACALCVGERVLLDEVRLALRRDERRWLQGPNGCGKTTLLRAAVAACDLPDERCLFVGQRLDLERVRRRFAGLSPGERQRALHIGATLALDAEAVIDDAPLSPGECRKLAVSVGLVTEPWLIVLDEPTNDLDLDSVERLEDALADFPGALFVVTHDRRFAEAVDARPLRLFDEGP